MTNASRYRIGMDVGGTFTDCVLLKEDGSIVLEKAPTTPGDQSEGVFAGLARDAPSARFWREVHRDRVPALLPEPRARAARPRDRARGVSRRRPGVVVPRGLPEAARVRAHVHDARERVRRTADRPVPEPARQS